MVAVVLTTSVPPNPRGNRLEVLGGELPKYTLAVTFGDRSRQVINFRPVLRGELFGPLRDIEVFNQVRLDSEVGTLTWPNGADFDPATLHDWPIVRKPMLILLHEHAA